MRSVRVEPGERAELYEHCSGPLRMERKADGRDVYAGYHDPLVTIDGWW